jgi:DNA-binding NtrC family response regulator
MADELRNEGLGQGALELKREAEPQTETSEAVPTGNERILFIDDEHAIVDTVKEMLIYFGYEVVTMTSPIEALEAFRAGFDKFDLVITDMTMPKMTGEKLAKEMLEIRPDIPIILCTGHSDMISEEETKELGIKEFIMKPIGKREMAMTIRSVLDHGKEA